MKTTAILAVLAAVLAVLPRAAPAAEEPEAVYARFHRAAMAGDVDEMLKYGLAKRRAEMQGASAATREATLKLVQFMAPRAFKLENKAVNARAGRATLIVSGPFEGGRHDMDTVYGTVKMLMENGEWKVDEASWGYDKPPVLAAQKPAGPAAGKGAASTTGAQPVGSTSQVRKLGEAKPECVYKPVMTAEDVERCK
ncbi:MAG TPA: hypothetical protein VIF38_11585 [Burkholderiales bacterium]|jgi:hypothetical protein